MDEESHHSCLAMEKFRLEFDRIVPPAGEADRPGPHGYRCTKALDGSLHVLTSRVNTMI